MWNSAALCYVFVLSVYRSGASGSNLISPAPPVLGPMGQGQARTPALPDKWDVGPYSTLLLLRECWDAEVRVKDFPLAYWSFEFF